MTFHYIRRLNEKELREEISKMRLALSDGQLCAEEAETFERYKEELKAIECAKGKEFF
jgi:hypothetical protein